MFPDHHARTSVIAASACSGVCSTVNWVVKFCIVIKLLLLVVVSRRDGEGELVLERLRCAVAPAVGELGGERVGEDLFLAGLEPVEDPLRDRLDRKSGEEGKSEEEL